MVAKAAQYLRMSTEHQRYSLEHQAAAIADYAAARGFELVRTYTDAGISGLRLENRPGLKQLLADVVTGEWAFEVILVYDVSRWGRFQNPDQSAHYEFLCAEAGVRVEYCAEPFANDGSVSSTIIKSLKRVMAAEYSRELAAKVSLAQRRLAAKGYWQGSTPGYGLRRQIVEPDGRRGAVLQSGEWKAAQHQHTILVPGPRHEIEQVQRIHRLFQDEKLSCPQIATRLNEEGVPAQGGTRWTRSKVAQVLTNPKYVGDPVSQRSSQPFGRTRIKRPPADWVRQKGAFKGLVSRRTFEATQAEWRRRGASRSDDEILDRLRRLLAEHGRLNEDVINRAPDFVSSACLRDRFGTVREAYHRIGYAGARRAPLRISEDQLMRRLAELFIREHQITSGLIQKDPALPSWQTVCERLGTLAEIRARLGVVRLTKRQMASPIGKARAAAMAAQLERSIACRKG